MPNSVMYFRFLVHVYLHDFRVWISIHNYFKFPHSHECNFCGNITYLLLSFDLPGHMAQIQFSAKSLNDVNHIQCTLYKWTDITYLFMIQVRFPLWLEHYIKPYQTPKRGDIVDLVPQSLWSVFVEWQSMTTIKLR